jgi:hypothetical protein
MISMPGRTEREGLRMRASYRLVAWLAAAGTVALLARSAGAQPPPWAGPPGPPGPPPPGWGPSGAWGPPPVAYAPPPGYAPPPVVYPPPGLSVGINIPFL